MKHRKVITREETEKSHRAFKIKQETLEINTRKLKTQYSEFKKRNKKIKEKGKTGNMTNNQKL